MVEKLNDMIKHRYGKGLSIRRLAGIDSDLSTESSLRGEDLYIPIFVKDIFLGYGLVHEARDLSFDDQNQVSRLVRMILEPHLYSQHLERTINNIEIEKSGLTNKFAGGQSEEKTKAIFLFGSQAKTVQKISLEIHEMSENFSFLPFLDVAAQVSSLDDLQSLEGSTLVVDLEKNLSDSQQEILADFISKSPSGPLVIFSGSQSSLHLKLSEKLVTALKTIEFSVDRLPLDKGAMIEVLEMLYFKS